MIVTLLGISVITFIITRLAPGDPFSQQSQALSDKTSQALNEENIRQNRRIYGFEKPLIFNTRFDDVHTNLEKLFKEYAAATPIRKKSIEEELKELDILAVPYYLRFIDNLLYRELCVNGMQNAIFPADSYIRVRNSFYTVYPWWEAVKITLNEKSEYWKKWWNENSSRYTQNKAIIAVQNFLKNPKQTQEILVLGTLCVEELLKHFFTAEKNLQNAISQVLSRILKKTWNMDNTTSKEEREKNIYRWKSWWKYNEERFIQFPWYRDMFRIFTNTQYGMWLIKIITFDFDESYTYKRPVLTLIAERLPVSIQLSVFSIILTYLLSIPLGIFSATHQNKMSDKITTVTLFVLYSLPSFWVASMLLLFFTGGGNFPNLFPARYLHSIGAENFGLVHYILDWLWHLFLPVFCLTYGSLAYLSRQMRVGMLDVIRQDYIKTARAKGLSEKLVIYKHALKNALIPIVTILSAILPALIGGSIIIEEIFSIDGMGRLAFEAIMNRDYPIINAIAFFSAFLTLLGIFVADLLYAVVEPRIKFTGSKV